MEFPADILPLFLSFLDPPSLARMAQTSRTWKTLIYRTSVWKPFLWKPNPYHAGLFQVRKDSQHVGEPHALCFLTWVRQHFERDAFAHALALPLLEKGETIERYVRRLYRSWCSEKKPCATVHHHVWSSVFSSTSLPTLSPVEQLEIEKQVCVEWAPNHQTYHENPYAAWLASQILLFEKNWGSVYRPNTVLPPRDPFTLLQKIKAEHSTQRLAIHTELESHAKRIHDRLSRAFSSHLLRHPPRRFDENEGLVRSEHLWDRAAFTLATRKRPPPSDGRVSSTSPA